MLEDNSMTHALFAGTYLHPLELHLIPLTGAECATTRCTLLAGVCAGVRLPSDAGGVLLLSGGSSHTQGFHPLAPSQANFGHGTREGRLSESPLSEALLAATLAANFLLPKSSP